MTRMAADPRSLFPGKFFIITVLDALDTKTTMSGAMARRYLQRAGMAGIIIGVLYAANFAMKAKARKRKKQSDSARIPQSQA